MEQIDSVVIGAGVVGLAVARALALAGRDVIILDGAGTIGSGESSRNSEVIHAGLYYAPGSLKARLCARGRDLLYAYCRTAGVAHRRCGKLIVATDDHDVDRLDVIAARAASCGVTALHHVSRDAARTMEPALECRAALWSPDTGIIDSHALLAALLHDAEQAGASLALRTPFARAHRAGDGWQILTGDGDAQTLDARWIINCAGLSAQSVARAVDTLPHADIPPLHIAKGQYFALRGNAPFSRLIYPTPIDGGLGVHLTLDLAGQARFGPDVEWITPMGAGHDYNVDASRADAFAERVRHYWPALPADALQPAYAGLRAKLSGQGAPPADFRIDGPGQHQIAGIVNCFGIESPGLTSSLAIAEYICDMMARADA